MNVIDIAIAKTYTKDSLLGAGAVLGKNCTISSIVPINGGNQIIFEYTLDNGVQQTSTLDVLDAYGCALKDGFVGTESEWLESLKIDATELETVVQEKIETQLQDTIQETVDQAVDDVLSGSGDGSDTNNDELIDSWF